MFQDCSQVRGSWLAELARGKRGLNGTKQSLCIRCNAGPICLSVVSLTRARGAVLPRRQQLPSEVRAPSAKARKSGNSKGTPQVLSSFWHRLHVGRRRGISLYASGHLRCSRCWRGNAAPGSPALGTSTIASGSRVMMQSRGDMHADRRCRTAGRLQPMQIQRLDRGADGRRMWTQARLPGTAAACAGPAAGTLALSSGHRSARSRVRSKSGDRWRKVQWMCFCFTLRQRSQSLHSPSMCSQDIRVATFLNQVIRLSRRLMAFRLSAASLLPGRISRRGELVVRCSREWRRCPAG